MRRAFSVYWMLLVFCMLSVAQGSAQDSADDGSRPAKARVGTLSDAQGSPLNAPGDISQPTNAQEDSKSADSDEEEEARRADEGEAHVGAAPSELLQLSTGGSYRTGIGLNITVRNLWHWLRLDPNDRGGVIRQVRWTWTLYSPPFPPELQVFLCRLNTSDCLNVTGSQSGVTTFWGGKTSNVPFYFYFVVGGSGSLFPVLTSGVNVLQIDHR
jgi:hypothetical protein